MTDYHVSTPSIFFGSAFSLLRLLLLFLFLFFFPIEKHPVQTGSFIHEQFFGGFRGL